MRQSNPTLLALLTSLALLLSGNVRADRFQLDVGAVLGGSAPATGGNGPYFDFGLAAKASYELGRWAFSAYTRGTFTTETSVRLHIDGIEAEGSSSKRGAAYGPMIRYLFGEQTYVEGGFLVIENEFSDLDSSFGLPPIETNQKLFSEGYGATLGAGVLLKNSPYFLQLNIEVDKLNQFQVVRTQKYLNQVVLDTNLINDFHVVNILLIVGVKLF